MLTGSETSVHAMVGLPFQADVVLVAPREFEATTAQRTYREKNFTSFAELVENRGFQKDYVRRINESLGLECLATYLREQGVRVAIINCNVVEVTVDELAERIRRSGARIVGMSLIYSPQVERALELTQQLAGEVDIVMGGALASFMKHQLLSCLPGLTAIVYGEAEETFTRYVLHRLQGRPISGCRGVAYREGGRIRINPAEAPLDLAAIRAPQRDTLAYLKAAGHPTRIASIYTSRGCMAKCTFCTGKDAYNVDRRRTYRFRDPDDVVDEIETLHRRFGVKFVYINDDNFLGYGNKSERRVERLARSLIDRQLEIEFATECRVDSLDPGLLLLLKKAGMVQVLLGLESGSEPVLKRWRKGVTVEQNLEAVRLIRSLGINVEPGFILVDAHTTADEIADNIRFIEAARLHQTPFPTYLINRLSVYPGTEIETTLTAQGILPPSRLSPFSSTCGSVAEIQREFERLRYAAVDPRADVFWRCLQRAIAPIEEAVEDVLPRLTQALLAARGGRVGVAVDAARAQVRQMARWRRFLGELILDLLRAGLAAYEEPTLARQIRRFRHDARRLRAAYDTRHLSSSFDEWLDGVVKTYPRAA